MNPALRIQQLFGRHARGWLGLVALALLALLASGLGLDRAGPQVAALEEGDRLIAEAFANRRGGVQVAGSGVVERVLPDDTRGSRHQRFILRLASGQAVLVAHNIDLAPRIPSLRVGDEVAFNGEYEWNDKGGVMHWTHHDPAGRHEDGWLRHEGKLYD